MEFELGKTLEILERTPAVLEALLHGLSDEWVHSNEGGQTWNVAEVLGHLILCEQTNFIPRAEIILLGPEGRVFDRQDMEAHLSCNRGKALADLLAEFKQLRQLNVKKLLAFTLSPADLQKTGTHPVLGQTTLAHLLATWTAHDLTHLSQIARVMAKQYKEAVGPFIQFIRILQ